MNTYEVIAGNLQFRKGRKLKVGDRIPEADWTAEGINVEALAAGGLVKKATPAAKKKEG